MSANKNHGELKKKQINKKKRVKKKTTTENNDYNRLVEANYKLVWSIVNKFSYLRDEKEDLFQSGCIGLVLAAKKFDRNYGTQFSTFAVPYILGEVRNYLRYKNQIKLSKKVLSNQRKINKVIEESDENLSIMDISNKLDMNYEDVILSYNSRNKVMSLEQTVVDDQTMLSYKNLDNKYDINIDQIYLRDYISKLPEVEKNLIYYRYYYGLTQNEVSKKLAISQSKVSRLEKQILQKLKEYYIAG
ncbi:sigma-70 family RNA polymerase sigma factor [Haloplasma contractile]|uniref:RNA polymerase sigma factor n=1 Tax=Haloplasma contractile SSD-17B TaxID=1033810 RepID=F7Q1A3_9MOLU|nr:sigma-70 family RNA polymerase sigma factor [Haloplasma contractile]ERJ12820.1 RNA polymerase sigma-F factor protein [Haloplasma contractile SSD-17B]